jgi:hypothetical protein
MVIPLWCGRLFPVQTDAKALRQEQDTRDRGEQAGDPPREGKPEQDVQTEDEEKQGEK